MAHKLIWTGPALTDLQEITDYIRRDSPHFAAIVKSNIRRTAKSLKRFPLSSRIVPEFENDRIREAIEGKYRIIVFIEDDTIYVVRILHFAQDFLKQFSSSLN